MFNGKLNILLNNVEASVAKPTLEYNAEDFSLVMTTNFESAFHLCQLAHPLLKASGAASIILVSSGLGLVLANVGTVYSATKVSNPNWTPQGDKGGFFFDSVSVHASSLFHNRSDYLCSRRIYSEWLFPPKHLIAITYKKLAQVVKER
ncbi:hypothetical protein CUMW_033450 [Citrus unshiu]|nr:hypothetical protein CUMW_033450 [Citrus unshiu]